MGPNFFEVNVWQGLISFEIRSGKKILSFTITNALMDKLLFSSTLIISVICTGYDTRNAY